MTESNEFRLFVRAIDREPRAHISLKHSLNPDMIGRYVTEVIRESKSTSFSTTESSEAYQRAIAEHLGDGWIVTRAGEYVTGVRRDRFRRVRTRLPRLTRLTKVYVGREEWRDLFVSRSLYIHKESGRYYAIGAGHPPSRVQDGENWDKKNPRGVRASKRGVDRLGRWVLRVLTKHAGAVVAIGLDSNVNHHLKVWRERFTRRLNLKSCWDRQRPDSNIGTHGFRLIDAIYSNTEMLDSHISPVKPPKGVDHKAVVTTLAFRRLK